MFFLLVLKYDITTILLQILISLRFYIHLIKGVHWCSRKSLFEFLEEPVHWCFEKTSYPKIFAIIPARHLGWSPFLIYLQTSMEIF